MLDSAMALSVWYQYTFQCKHVICTHLIIAI